MRPYDFFCLVEKYFTRLDKFHQYHNQQYKDSADKIAVRIKREIQRVRTIKPTNNVDAKTIQ